MALISFQNVTKRYENEFLALERADFQIGKGEFVFFIGRNGAGKSTVLKLISGQIFPTEGTVTVKGEDTASLTKAQKPVFRRQFGLMAPEVGLVPGRTVYENIALALRVSGKGGWKLKDRVEHAMSLTGSLACRDKQAENLSGGETARALLARALVMEPEILVADEPTANLDPDHTWDFMCLLEQLNRSGLTVLVSSHDREMVSVMRKRVITLAAGRIVADEKKAIYNSKASDIFEERRILNERAGRELF